MVSMVSWFQFRDVNGFISFVGSSDSWFYRFRGVNGFMVSYVSFCQWFHGFIGFVMSIIS